MFAISLCLVDKLDLLNSVFVVFRKRLIYVRKIDENYELIMILFIVKYLEWSLYILVNVIINQKLGVNIL